VQFSKNRRPDKVSEKETKTGPEAQTKLKVQEKHPSQNVKPGLGSR
jgi:hypothetical protein